VCAIGAQGDNQILARLPFKDSTSREPLGLAQVLATIEIVDESITLAGQRREAGAHGVRNRDIERRAQLGAVVRAGRQLHRTAKLAFRAARADQDRTADTVASEQRTLRAAQHLDRLDVGEIKDTADAAGEIHIVDVQAHAGFGAERHFVGADAPDEYRGSAGAAPRSGHRCGR
jgi:hypothetical protein